MVYSVFVEHTSSIRSFCKIATTDKAKAEEAYQDMVDYFTHLCEKEGNCIVRDWANTMSISCVACTIIKGDKSEHIIHFDMFRE